MFWAISILAPSIEKHNHGVVCFRRSTVLCASVATHQSSISLQALSDPLHSTRASPRRNTRERTAETPDGTRRLAILLLQYNIILALQNKGFTQRAADPEMSGAGAVLGSRMENGRMS